MWSLLVACDDIGENPLLLVQRIWGHYVKKTSGRHCVCIVETWLDHNISDNEIHLPGFQLYLIVTIMVVAYSCMPSIISLWMCYPHNFRTMYLTTLEFLPISVKHIKLELLFSNNYNHQVLVQLLLTLSLRLWKIWILDNFVILFF